MQTTMTHINPRFRGINLVPSAIGVFILFPTRPYIFKLFHSYVAGCVRLDPASTFKTLDKLFRVALVVSLIVLVGSIAVPLLLLSHQMIENREILLFLLLMVLSIVVLCSAVEHRFSEGDFDESGGWSGGFEMLRKWSAEFPQVHQFVHVNNMMHGFSTFNFNLVQSYVRDVRKAHK